MCQCLHSEFLIEFVNGRPVQRHLDLMISAELVCRRLNRTTRARSPPLYIFARSLPRPRSLVPLARSLAAASTHLSFALTIVAQSIELSSSPASSIHLIPSGRPLPRAMAAAAAARSIPSGVPAPRVPPVVVVVVLLLVLVGAPCGGARPMREGVGSGTATATARARASPALDDAGHWPRGGAATAAGAHRVTTVGGGAPTPPSGPSQNHN